MRRPFLDRKCPPPTASEFLSPLAQHTPLHHHPFPSKVQQKVTCPVASSPPTATASVHSAQHCARKFVTARGENAQGVHQDDARAVPGPRGQAACRTARASWRTSTRATTSARTHSQPLRFPMKRKKKVATATPLPLLYNSSTPVLNKCPPCVPTYPINPPKKTGWTQAHAPCDPH